MCVTVLGNSGGYGKMRPFYYFFLVFIVILEISVAAKYWETTNSDPGQYYAKSQLRAKHRKKNGDLRGSSSSSSKKKKNGSKLKYAFLKPENSDGGVKEEGETCKPQSGYFNAFTFMNFALAAATLAGNLVANSNNNNRNNNNNNNK